MSVAAAGQFVISSGYQWAPLITTFALNAIQLTTKELKINTGSIKTNTSLFERNIYMHSAYSEGCQQHFCYSKTIFSPACCLVDQGVKMSIVGAWLVCPSSVSTETSQANNGRCPTRARMPLASKERFPVMSQLDIFVHLCLSLNTQWILNTSDLTYLLLEPWLLCLNLWSLLL